MQESGKITKSAMRVGCPTNQRVVCSCMSVKAVCVSRTATTLLTLLRECFLVNAVTSNCLSNKYNVIFPYRMTYHANKTTVLEDCDTRLNQICFLSY